MNGVNPAMVQALRGPVIMITVGVLFLLDRFTGFEFGQTWPVLLIVLGLMALAGGGRRSLNRPPDVPLDSPNYPSSSVPPNMPPPGGRR